ncbi:54S ribosomal protein L49, mitochondrial precursor [Didymella exigua CBS 183.55]|uniref:Large ribosomal subunit protein bL21m n=1 Tax=Didymella exigua CBS 183.55 TaxID=1150837 RepID=A0A6A5RXN2_9PLEO|nr:54S ribosomal protein L49, mitochondrial precursor [Didymella exigua CBS 183.55]KAF1932343.1 54S ribosomal protein L49, mitochondrial precursor [Didymella exigua CBS 183.55]
MASLARTARSALRETRRLPAASLPPRAAHMTTQSHALATGNTPDPLLQSGQRVSPALQEKTQSHSLSPSAPPPSTPVAPHGRSEIVSAHVTPSIRTLLPLLHSQPAHYMTLHIHGRPYLLTRGDTLRLPFLMPDVKPGDVLRLNRATHIGSRDYTLKAAAAVKGTADAPKKLFYLDERLFTVRARVVGIETEPMRVEEKTKRRQRHTKHVYSKMRFTVLKISDMELKSLEAYERVLAEESDI